MKAQQPAQHGQPAQHASAVQVVNFPPPDLVSLHWAEAGVIIGLIALVVAVITLLRVNRQIVLAKDALVQAVAELKVSENALTLTRESNDLVRQSLAHSEAQVEALHRRARLAAFTSKDGVRFAGVGADISRRFVQIVLVNAGTRSARGSLLQVLVPPKAWPDIDCKGWEQVAMMPSNGGENALYEAKIGETVFPASAVTISAELIFAVPRENKDHPLRYRIIYDDGITPENGDFLHLPTREEANLDGIIAGL